MTSMRAPRGQLRHASKSSVDALKKLFDTSKSIQTREDVRLKDAKRIKDAFTLMAEPREPSIAGVSQATKRRERYRWLLRKVEDAVGAQLVVLCAVGLGLYEIGRMKELCRMDLVTQIKQQNNALKSAVLQRIADMYSGLGPLLDILNSSVIHISSSYS